MSSVAKGNCIQTHLIPATDAEAMRLLMRKAAVYSGYSSPLKAHLGATAFAVMAVALTILSIPAYVVRSLCDFTVKAINMQLTSAFALFATNLANAGKCLILTALSIVYIVGGFLFPSRVFPMFSPTHRKEIKETTEEVRNKYLAVKKDLEEKNDELHRVEKELKSLLASNAAADRQNKALSSFEDEKAKIQQEMEKLQSQFKEITEHYETHNAEIMKKLDETQKELSELETLRKEKGDLEERVDSLQKEIAKKEKEDDEVPLEEPMSKLNELRGEFRSKLQSIISFIEGKKKMNSKEGQEWSTDNKVKLIVESLNELQKDMAANRTLSANNSPSLAPWQFVSPSPQLGTTTLSAQ